MASKAEEWLEIPVPYWGSPEWHAWLAACRELGDDCIPVFFEALQYGTPLQQYSALLGVRWHGYEAFGVGYGHAISYEVRAPGSADIRMIKPAITEPAVDPAQPPLPTSPRLGGEARRWVAAGVVLGNDAHAVIACPQCEHGTLTVDDVHANIDLPRFERIMRCAICSATNVLLMRRNE